jgi:hypothetical protein
MNQKNTHSNRWTIVVEKPEIPPPSLPGEVLAGVQVKGEPEPQRAPTKTDPPKWRNLTLAEMYTLLEEAKRQEAFTQ